MAESSVLHAQAIGSAAPGQRARCMFCHALIGDEGAGFTDHVEGSPDCRDGYAAWLDNLDQDRPGGG